MPFKVTILLVALVFIACGSDAQSEAPVLHLRGFDISEENYRAGLKATKAQNPVGFAALCEGVTGLSDEGAISFIRNVQDDSEDREPWAGETPVSGQEPEQDSMIRVIQMIREECA